MNIVSIPVDSSGESTRIVRAGVFTIVFFLGGSLLWSALAPISSAVVAEGSIKVDTQRKTIQHLEGGLVRAILVHEGDRVQSGQPLLVLEDAAVLSNLNVLRDQRDAELAREARLLAEKTMARRVEFPETLRLPETAKKNALMHNEQSVFQVRKKSLEEEIGVIRREIHSADMEETAILSEIESAQESIRYKEERLAAGIKLSEKQYIQKEQLLTMKEALTDKRQTSAQLRGRLASLKQQQSELELRIINLHNEYAKNADNELKDVRRSIFELEEKIRPVELVLNRSQIVAPIAGQVIDLKVTTVGGVVRPGDPLMDVVPDQKSLILEVRVKTTDVDKIYVGQLADVKLLAYNARQIPHVPGHVSYVSGDALRDQQAGGNRLAEYYLVHIRVDEAGLADLQKNYPDVIMTPGMPVTGFIQTRPRTFFQILLKPFLDSVSRGLRMET
jgi:epimerase transport system membrane fusion protein